VSAKPWQAGTGLLLLALLQVAGEAVAAQDDRLRSMFYDEGRVYRLHGYVGYQIDLEFEPGESFVGIGAGDLEGIGYAAQDNHLFIKPRAARVQTNLTVLTTRRSYHFEYTVLSGAVPEPRSPDLLFTLRFTYPAVAPRAPQAADDGVARALDRAPEAARNRDYWYCGSPSLQPLSAFDDGIGTHLRFNPRRELPAIFVRNDDGSESLLNFSVHDGEVTIHRVAERYIVRRGALRGCIVNRSFSGSGRELSSGTVSEDVERATRGGEHGR
jgi:type IV secretion system protein VirB9